MEPKTPFELDQIRHLQRTPIKEWQHVVYLNNVEHGFYDGEHTIDATYLSRNLMLIVGELAEAQEELRSGHTVSEVYYAESGKPEGFGIELADAAIRILDLAEHCGMDLAALMAEKHRYNVGRPYKHGRQF